MKRAKITLILIFLVPIFIFGQGTLVKDINPLPATSEPKRLTQAGTIMYFTSSTIGYGSELWRSDGTEAGTVIVKDIYPGSGSGFPHDLLSFNNNLYFVAIDENGIDKLWKSDGTDSGTQLVFDGDLIVSPSPYFTPVNDDLYFVGSIANSGFELLKYTSLTTGTGKEDLSDRGMLIYPNPTTGPITIKYNMEGAPATFCLLDLIGKKIIEMEMTPDLFQINLKGINPGIYIYQVKAGNSVLSGKIVLK